MGICDPQIEVNKVPQTMLVEILVLLVPRSSA